MTINSLLFFDKFGENLNLELVSNVWTGTIYFDEISTYLYDNENIFILEKVGAVYKYPVLNPGDSFEFKWTSNKNENEFFIYEVYKDLQLKENFISRVEDKAILYSSVYPGGNSALDIKAPMQLNIGFSPTEEIKYERTLQIFYKTSTSTTLVATLKVYGEGIEEDERYRIWAQNFGIKFLKEDANILKDYDIKEAIPSWKEVNAARKELLVSKEHIYPYIGTYKGLSNFVNILGYKDVLQIKEYWRNVNRRSSYYNTLTLVDISDYLDDGKIDTLNLLDENKNLKEGGQFRKTEFLALVYQFTRATDQFDDDGIPLVEETTQFTVNEIFYKLNNLNKKLKDEFLPINVKIKDIIGEFIYFQKITISYWRDDNQIFDYSLNQSFDLTTGPSPAEMTISIQDLNPLYRSKSSGGIDFGIDRINLGEIDPYEFDQKYTKSQNAELIGFIEEYYSSVKNQRSKNIGSRLLWEYGDDPEKKIGAPIILTFNVQKVTLAGLKGVKLQDLGAMYPGMDPYWTLENIDYRNFFEITWKITKDAPNPYNFEYRGRLVDLNRLAHFLPSPGEYRIVAQVTDFFGNITVLSSFITVDLATPQIIGFTRLEDKFDYTIKNLENIQLQDFGASTLYYPKVTVLDNEDSAFSIDIYKNLLEWISFYKNRYGLGQNINDVELYDVDSNTYVAYNDPVQNHPKKLYWGLGEDGPPIKIKDFRDISVGDLYWARLTNFVHLDDFNAGFYIRNPSPGAKIKVSLYSEYTLPNFSTLEELVDILNDSDHPAISLFNYEIINGRKSDNQYIVHAQAKYLSRITYHILSQLGGFSPSPKASPSPAGGKGAFAGDKYTFFLPKGVFSKSTVNFLKTISPVFDEETLFLHAKTSDVISGAVQDPLFWQEQKYWKFTDDVQRGYLPTTIDQNAFNISDIKLFEETFALPENGIGFFVVNNIDAKNDFIWTLTDSINNIEIVRAKSVPFFVWKFKDQGQYTLKVQVFDAKRNEYVNEMQNFIRVLDKRRYIKETEDRLNYRKIQLLRNRVNL
jgi:hypothetical protein